MGSEYLNILKEKRIKWVEASRENNFEAGIKNLLTELYPDNAHFIYELLQNAEDAGATKVSFNLEADKITTIHNGTRLFNQRDVEGITSIGEGTKRDDINKIGKFGVGFKAVFSYTTSPQIFSGDFHFEIRNLVVPYMIKPINKKTDETVFIFSFNNARKPANIAFQEIKKGLKELNKITLLFLSNIREINIKFEGSATQILKIDNPDTPFVRITDTKYNQTYTFLCFKEYLPNSNILYAGIAFEVQEDQKSRKLYIKQPTKGEVSIYFPAEKESSNLFFHLHAPFSSTVARDSIKNIKDNNQLIGLIANLLCDATKWIKDNKFLDHNFLKCLPNNDDNLSEFYKPIQARIIRLFQNEKYLPCDDDDYHPANKCFRSSKSIKDIIDINILKILSEIEVNTDIYWIKNPSQRNSREDKFIQQLEVAEITEENILQNILKIVDEYVSHDIDIINDLKNLIEESENKNLPLSVELKKEINDVGKIYKVLSKAVALCQDDNHSSNIANSIMQVVLNFLKLKGARLLFQLNNKEDEWIKKFYELLYQLIEGERKNSYWFNQRKYQNLKILIKSTKGEFNFRNIDLYFPTETPMESYDMHFVDPKVYEKDSTSKNQKSRQFLELLGVKEISLENEVEYILNSIYGGSKSVSSKDNLKHINTFLKYYVETDSMKNKSNIAILFKRTRFLIDAKDFFRRADEILIDHPWEKTNLNIIEGDNKRQLLSNYYHDKLPKDKRKVFLQFIKDLDAITTLPIEKQQISKHPNSYRLITYGRETEYCINQDYNLSVDTIERIEKQNIEISLLVWNSLINNSKTEYFEAVYRPNSTAQTKTDLSSLIYTLRRLKWVPDRNSKFHKPADILKEELHELFSFKNDNLFLSKIDFGSNKQSSIKEIRKLEQEVLKATGVSLQTLKELNELTGNPEKFLKEFIEKRRTELEHLATPNLKNAIEKHNKGIEIRPSIVNPDIIKDEEKYRDRVQRNFDENLKKSKNGVLRKVTYQKVKIGNDETKLFLQNQYNGCCQICGFTFDKIEGNEKHFELFNWFSEKISKQKVNIIDAGSALCLCSRCHSILKYGDFKLLVPLSEDKYSNISYSDFIDEINQQVVNADIPNVYLHIEMDLLRLPIRILNKTNNIFFTEEHFLRFYNLLNLQEDTLFENEESIIENVQESDGYIESDNVDAIIINDQRTESFVKIDDIIHVTVNENKYLKIKISYHKTPWLKNLGVIEISPDSFLAKQLLGQMNQSTIDVRGNTYKIINIE